MASDSRHTDGGPAFPSSFSADEWRNLEAKQFLGMTLRDYFAGQALEIALTECPRPVPIASWDGGRLPPHAPAYEREMDEWRKKLSATAYRIADAMLAAREARQS